MPLLLSTRKHSALRIQHIAECLGFDGIEFVIPSRNQGKRAKMSLKGLKSVRVIHAPVDEYDKDRFNSALSDTVSVASSLGVSIVNIHPASGLAEFGGRNNVLDGIERIKEVQRKSSLVVCYEVLTSPDPLKDSQLRQQAYAKPGLWLQDVKTYNLPATLDTTHVASWGEDPAWYIAQLGPLLRHIHLSDFNNGTGEQHLFPGEGDGIIWENFFAALRKAKRPDVYNHLRTWQQIRCNQSRRTETLGAQRGVRS